MSFVRAPRNLLLRCHRYLKGLSSARFINYRVSISSGARAREGKSRNGVLKNGFNYDSSLHCFLRPITPSLYPVAENRDHFWRLNFIQKLGDCLQQLFWTVERLVDERSLHITEKAEVRWCKIRTATWVRHTSNMVFSDKLLSGL
jgi:hypothetical protein